jgi:hypothetical protein
MRLASKPGLANLDRPSAQILTVKLQQIEGGEHGGVVV